MILESILFGLANAVISFLLSEFWVVVILKKQVASSNWTRERGIREFVDANKVNAMFSLLIAICVAVSIYDNDVDANLFKYIAWLIIPVSVPIVVYVGVSFVSAFEKVYKFIGKYVLKIKESVFDRYILPEIKDEKDEENEK